MAYKIPSMTRAVKSAGLKAFIPFLSYKKMFPGKSPDEQWRFSQCMKQWASLWYSNFNVLFITGIVIAQFFNLNTLVTTLFAMTSVMQMGLMLPALLMGTLRRSKNEYLWTAASYRKAGNNSSGDILYKKEIIRISEKPRAGGMSPEELKELRRLTNGITTEPFKVSVEETGMFNTLAVKAMNILEIRHQCSEDKMPMPISHNMNLFGTLLAAGVNPDILHRTSGNKISAVDKI